MLSCLVFFDLTWNWNLIWKKRLLNVTIVFFAKFRFNSIVCIYLLVKFVFCLFFLYFCATIYNE